MEVRYIKPEEAVDFQRVSAASFIWKFDEEEDSTVKFPVVAAFDEGKLIAGAEIYRYKTNFCGNIINSIFADGICTKPECRRMGGVREIFGGLSELAEREDWTLGFLHPFSIEYYEKFGYANLNSIFSVKVPFSKLGGIARNTNVTLYTGEEFKELRELYEKCALRTNLMTLRESRQYFCETPLENAEYTYLRRDENGVADGYVRFTVERPNNLVVDEMFVLSPKALYGLVGFLRNYDGIAENLIVKKQHQGSPFACFANRLDGVSHAKDGELAGRIYDLKKLLECNEYPKEYGKFSILSIDDIERNKGIFDVEYQNGKAVVTRRNDGDFDISLTAAAAAKLMLSGEGFDENTAEYIGGVEIKGCTCDFFRAFPHRPTYFLCDKWFDEKI